MRLKLASTCTERLVKYTCSSSNDSYPPYANKPKPTPSMSLPPHLLNTNPAKLLTKPPENAPYRPTSTSSDPRNLPNRHKNSKKDLTHNKQTNKQNRKNAAPEPQNSVEHAALERLWHALATILATQDGWQSSATGNAPQGKRKSSEAQERNKARGGERRKEIESGHAQRGGGAGAGIWSATKSRYHSFRFDGRHSWEAKLRNVKALDAPPPRRSLPPGALSLPSPWQPYGRVSSLVRHQWAAPSAFHPFIHRPRLWPRLLGRTRGMTRPASWPAMESMCGLPHHSLVRPFLCVVPPVLQ